MELMKWLLSKPDITERCEGELASRLLERQRLRMEESSASVGSTPDYDHRQSRRHATGEKNPTVPASSSTGGATAIVAPAAAGDVRSRSRLPCPQVGRGHEHDSRAGSIACRTLPTTDAMVMTAGSGGGGRGVGDAGRSEDTFGARTWGSGRVGQQGKGQGLAAQRLTMQACFKEEREAFIRDLQVLHRQLEAKDRDRAKREREHQEASARARAEARAAQERAVALTKEVEEAVVIKARAEAKANAAVESLDRQTATVESLRARLRHAERQHKELMNIERRQQSAATEDANAERRRLESAALASRTTLGDGRREWSAEKNTLLAAVREAGHRAELAEGEAAEVKANALSLEQRLQQTLEREASLNSTIDKQREAAREAERQVARAEGDAGRARAAAAAQEEALVESIKDLEARVARSDILRSGEQSRREDLQAQLERERETALTAVTEAQREASVANRRAVALSEEAAALRSETESYRRRAREADSLARNAGGASEKLGVGLKLALAENDDLVAAAAKERETLQKQWQRREDTLRLALQKAQQQQQQQQQSGKTMEPVDGVPAEDGVDVVTVLAEMEKLQAQVMSLSRDKEDLLRSLADARRQQQQQRQCQQQRECQQQQQQQWSTPRPCCNVDADNRSHCSVREEVVVPTGRSGGEGGYVAPGGGGRKAEGGVDSCDDNVDAVGDSGIDGDGDDDDDGVEDDEVLVPRGGPIPVPSPLTPRGGAGVVGVGMGPFGRPTGRSMAAAALLRSTLTREREERRREHETLLELLRRAEEERGRRRGGASETRRRPDGNRSGDSRSGSASDSSLRGRDLETTAFARSYRGHDNTVDLAVPNASTTASSKRHRDVQREAPCESDRGRCMPPPPALPATPASLPLSSDAWQALIAGLEGSLLRAISSSRSSSSSSSCNNTCRNPCRRNHRRRRQPQPQPQPQLERGSSTERSSDINIRSATDGGSTTQRRRRRRGRGDEKGYVGGKAAAVAAVESEDGEGERAVTCDNDSAVISALTAALRELLAAASPPPGVPLGKVEEDLRKASLPELIAALRREWDVLLEGMEAMQEELQTARRHTTTNNANAMSTTTAPPSTTGATSPSRSPAHSPVAAAAAAAANHASGTNAERQRAAKLEKALYCAEETRAAVECALQQAEEAREAAEGALKEAEGRLAASEREHSKTTAQLASTLQASAAERSAMDAERSAVSAERAAERSAAAAAAASSAAVTAALRRALEQRETESERTLEELSRRRAAEIVAEGAKEEVEKRRREAERAHREVARKVAAAREEGRKESERRVEALESALDSLAETGSAAEGLSKEQLEITRELSAERDELLEESQRCSERLHELTTAVRELRDEKARLANQLSDRERGLEALRAQSEVERSNLARLQAEVERAQVVCGEMTHRLLELQETQEELRKTRESLLQANRELDALRRSRDQLDGVRKEASRAREQLHSAKRLGSEMSKRAEEAEARVKREKTRAVEASQRMNQLEARAEALQQQLDQVPKDLLVAHAEKRVLQGALNHAEASAEAEIRRRDADIRSFASAAAIEQERYGQRLREQALTIHQLTLQNFSAEAQATAAAAIGAAPVATAVGATTMPTAGGCVRKSTLATVGAEGRGGGWDAPDTSYGRHRDKGTADVAGRLALRTGDLYIDDDRGNRQRTVSGHEDHACRPLTAASGSACIASDSGIGGHKPRLGRAHHSVDSGFPGSLPLVASPTSLVTKGLEREGQRSAGFRRCLNRPAVQGQIGGESVVGVGRAASSRPGSRSGSGGGDSVSISSSYGRDAGDGVFGEDYSHMR